VQIQASVPPTIALSHISASNDNSLPPVHPSIDLTYLFGHAPSSDQQTLYSSYAAQVAMLVWTSEQYGTSHIPVVVGVALKAPRSSEGASNVDRVMFLQIMELVREVLGNGNVRLE